MPLYEYRCTTCGYSFEKIQSFSATPESECPKCHGVLIRPVTAPALRFEGAGWYVNDYAGKGGAKSGESAEGAKPQGAADGKAEAKSESTSSSESATSTSPATTTATAPTSTTAPSSPTAGA